MTTPDDPRLVFAKRIASWTGLSASAVAAANDLHSPLWASFSAEGSSEATARNSGSADTCSATPSHSDSIAAGTHADDKPMGDLPTMVPEKKPIKHESFASCPFGNFHKYYEYRLVDGKDERLECIPVEFVSGKDCMDVGCNSGVLTLELVKHMAPKSMYGIDVDGFLIQAASERYTAMMNSEFGLDDPHSAVPSDIHQHHNHHHSAAAAHPVELDPDQCADAVKSNELLDVMFDVIYPRAKLRHKSKQTAASAGGRSLAEIPGFEGKPFSKLYIARKSFQAAMKESFSEITVRRARDFPISCPISYGPIVPLSVTGALRNSWLSCPVSFEQGNVLDLTLPPNCLDTIFCLSTIKWIHLHHGDDGIRRFFHIVSRSLRRGGHFVLEVQDWQSYRRRRNISQWTKKVYFTIQLKPETFRTVLENEFGFELVKTLRMSSEHRGFDRDISVYRKR